ncbi:hypothetical protein [Streptomyces sp. CB01373]|uniref:hypothetical protein n=1 Tax=Streptomyces sp. CB01373 TaxID=2020325 RepID=UPI000C2745F5|nr:hypothetical protein [Streptomyces sp. CB01373]PJM91803.1 hypothetical protein CG719_31830 [Streptomyces sp. CB01373]
MSATLPSIVVTRAPGDSVAILSGLYNTIRSAAGSVAAAVFAVVMSAMVTASPQGGSERTTVVAESAYTIVWLVCAGLALLVAVLAIGEWHKRVPARGR